MNATESAEWAEARRWLAKATQDQRCALLSLNDDPPLLDPAAYHCQQAAEKLLKALLAGSGATIPRSHDLQHLRSLAAPLFPELAPQIEAVSDWTPWGTGTRYPELDNDLGIMPQDIRDALDALDQLRDAVAAKAG